MNSFRNWYLDNQTEITWFLIGWLALAALEALSHGNYLSAVLDIVLIGVNYKLSK